MNIKMLAAASALALLAAGAAHAQDYGTPPYGSSAYAYGEGCRGFTIAGGYAGITLIGIDFGVSGRARVNGDCGGGGYAPQAAYSPPPPAYGPPPGPAYGGGGGYYNQPVYAPAAYSAPAYGYPQPAYSQPCGCGGQPPVVYQPY